jgi:hypothetical protein
VRSGTLIGVEGVCFAVGRLRAPFARPALNKTWLIARELLDELPIASYVRLWPKSFCFSCIWTVRRRPKPIDTQNDNEYENELERTSRTELMLM